MNKVYPKVKPRNSLSEPYVKQLQEKISSLEETLDGQSMEMQVVKSEMSETTKPSMIIFQLNIVLMEMLIEMNGYIQRNGLNPKAELSRGRITKMMEMCKGLNDLADANYNLKMTNRELHLAYQALRIEHRTLRMKLETLKNIDKF